MNKINVAFRYYTKEKGWACVHQVLTTKYKKRCRGLFKQVMNELFWMGYRNSIDTSVDVLSIDFV